MLIWTGIYEKIDYLEYLGADSIWLSPFYEYGDADMGYDWTNHTKVDLRFGSEDDLNLLLTELDRRGIKVILDFIPNHTSNKMEWFQKSELKEDGFADYYVWRPPANANFNETGELPEPPNAWMSRAPPMSAWKFSSVRNEFYLHNFLVDMPDLNLLNEGVREEIRKIMEYWLEKPAVYGFRIGAFNVLFEDFDNVATPSSQQNQTLEFLSMLRDLTAKYSSRDGLQRLFLLEMLDKGENTHWPEKYRNDTLNEAVIPFNFGVMPWKDESFTGDDLHQAVLDYLSSLPNNDYDEDDIGVASPCWEMDNHDTVAIDGSAYERVPVQYSEVVMMMTLLLPGTVIIYYGDEIGMSGEDKITCELTQDPYALPPYADECVGYPENSRDPARRPMQWDQSDNAGFSNTTDPNKPLWLPVNENNLDVINVESQKMDSDSNVGLFKRLINLRSQSALTYGDVFYPYHDREVFAYLRKSEKLDIGYLIVINIHEVSSYVSVDFTSIYPGSPKQGRTIIVTSQDGEPPLTEVDVYVDMSDVRLHSFEGLVLELDFAAVVEESE